MATLEKRGKSWRVTIFLGYDPVTGAPDYARKSFKAKTKQEATDIKVQFKAEVLKGQYIKDNPMTIAELLHLWLNRKVKTKEIREDTAENYLDIIDTQLIPTLGHISVQKLEPIHIDNYIIAKLESGKRNGNGRLSGSYVRQHIIILKSALLYAVYPLKIIKASPADPIPLPNIDEKEMLVLDSKGLDEFLNAAKNLLDFETYVLIFFTSYTGLRRGEVLGLKWGCVDWENETISVEKQMKQKKGGEKVFADLKTDKSKRILSV